MRVAIVGPGRLGTLLAVAGARAGLRVAAVGGGTPRARRAIAERVAGVRGHASAADAARGAELVLLTVPDDRLEEVVTELVRSDAVHPGQRLVHLSGAHGVRVLARGRAAGAEVAACHPAMTVPTGSVDPDLLVGTAWAVTAGAGQRAWAHQLVRDLGGDPHALAEDRRGLYHAALTVGSNAVGAAVATARQLLLAASVSDPGPFLTPLAHASVAAVGTRGAVAITGPIARGDARTVAAHLATIGDDVPALAETYRHLAIAVLATVRAQLDPETLAVLDAVLGEPSPGRARP